MSSFGKNWVVPRMQLLASRECYEKIVELTKEKVPGKAGPFDGSKLAEEVLSMVLGELQDSSGRVQAETALVTLGALAGFACQMAIREGLVKSGKVPLEKALTAFKTTNGELFYQGDLLNEILFSPKIASVFRLVAAAAHHLGAKSPPDLKNIVAYVNSTQGTTSFGIPRAPINHAPHYQSRDLLAAFWNPIRNFLASSLPEPSQWPMTIGLSAQKLILKLNGTIDPGLAASIVMETAVSFSRIDPESLPLAFLR